MKLVFEKRFEKDLKKIKDKQILLKVKEIIIKLGENNSFLELGANIKKMKGNERYWRIKIGDYRIGLEKDGESIILVRILHRKDIYRYFP